MRKLVLSLALLAVALPAAADWVVGDAWPDAPALAARPANVNGVFGRAGLLAPAPSTSV